MAPKRPSPLDEPPTASSSEEEETSSGEEQEEKEEGASTEGEEDEDERAEDQKSKKPTSLPPPKRSDPAMALNSPLQSSSSESGSGFDTDLDSESGKNMKSMASKPLEETPKAKNPRSKPLISATPVSSSAKGPSESIKDSKRTKMNSEADADEGGDSKKTGDESKKLFQRLWSEDDEIAILKGMLDYSANKGTDPTADMNAFHDFIKKSLHVDVSKTQLINKIRRLKKKYNNNARRGKTGQDPTFSKPHELKGFELSKKVWGIEGTSGNLEQSKSNGTPMKKQKVISSIRPSDSELLLSLKARKGDDKMDMDYGRSDCLNEIVGFEKKLGNWGLPESVVKKGLKLIEGSKREDMEQKWKKLHLAELELFVRRTELVRDQAKLILDAFKSPDK